MQEYDVSCEEVCPIELKTKANGRTASILMRKLYDHGGGKRFFRFKRYDELVALLGIPRGHVDQVFHHAAVLMVKKCLYVVGTVRSIAYVILFEFDSFEINRYILTLQTKLLASCTPDV